MKDIWICCYRILENCEKDLSIIKFEQIEKLRLEKEQATQIRMLRKEMAKMDSHLSHLKAKKILNEEDNEKKNTLKEEAQSKEKKLKRILKIQKDDNNEKKKIYSHLIFIHFLRLIWSYFILPNYLKLSLDILII
ncbi:hypothetical protein RFI_32779 [Reticulomyxa filosa]|uniref:CARD domain-containing protein n=1 Tax=Reticulomyxa filosa TaxID=46433 RepID=X6LTA2_RETFI|nr:hypothetical protein RFI_32779 [Reticulomyxa filosa]|eukprot:ETO04616.1 hypothetical protein RFI_32779 [Reticulomyxa filosa]